MAAQVAAQAAAQKTTQEMVAQALARGQAAMAAQVAAQKTPTLNAETALINFHKAVEPQAEAVGQAVLHTVTSPLQTVILPFQEFDTVIPIPEAQNCIIL